MDSRLTDLHEAAISYLAKAPEELDEWRNQSKSRSLVIGARWIEMVIKWMVADGDKPNPEVLTEVAVGLREAAGGIGQEGFHTLFEIYMGMAVYFRTESNPEDSAFFLDYVREQVGKMRLLDSNGKRSG